jgi:hypothetical protein
LTSPGDEVFEESTPPSARDKVSACDRHGREQHENAILTAADKVSPMRFFGAATVYEQDDKAILYVYYASWI